MAAKKGKRKSRPGAVASIKIDVTPPGLAFDSKALDRDLLVRKKGGHLSPRELNGFPWFRQDRPYQVGYHLLTHGLLERAGHAEFELCNVPGVFIEASASLLNELAARVLDGDCFAGGENMVFDDSDGSGLLKVIAFEEARPGVLLRLRFVC